MEDKDQIRKRLGRSPNHSDGLALTFGLPEAAAAGQLLSTAQATADEEGDDPWRFINK
jgi:hypothetical protein